MTAPSEEARDIAEVPAAEVVVGLGSTSTFRVLAWALLLVLLAVRRYQHLFTTLALLLVVLSVRVMLYRRRARIGTTVASLAVIGQSGVTISTGVDLGQHAQRLPAEADPEVQSLLDSVEAAGAMFAAFALLSALDGQNPKRFGNAAFWALMAHR